MESSKKRKKQHQYQTQQQQQKSQKQKQPTEEEHETTATAHNSGVNVDSSMTILDLKDDIFRDNICSFLDRQSILILIQKEKILSKRFQLCNYFCNGHGTRLVSVNKKERKEFKVRRRKQQRQRRRRNGGVHITANHPGCSGDCIMGLDGKLWCTECNAFKYVEDFAKCIMCCRKACNQCVAFISCEQCSPEEIYCHNCFDGFQCYECGEGYCNDCEDDCETFVSCAMCSKVTCSHECFDGFHCSECGEDYCDRCGRLWQFVSCDRCHRIACYNCEWDSCVVCHATICQDCSPVPPFFCDCDEYDHYCVDCRAGIARDANGTLFCSICASDDDEASDVDEAAF